MKRDKKLRKKRRKKRRKITLLVVVVILAAMVVGCTAYVMDYYHAEAAATECVENAVAWDETISIDDIGEDEVLTVQGDDWYAFIPEEPVAGFIFYPGAKVQYESYAPLMEKLAQQNVLCVLLHMTGNIAFLDINAAEGIEEQFPQVEEWYIGGHSLGGVAASEYLEKHAEDFEGIVFLASYPTADLSDMDLKLLSVYGSEDGVLTEDSYEESKVKWPADSTEYIIQGGCHAYFGNYGEQDGDGTATVTQEEQQQETVQQILEMIEK